MRKSSAILCVSAVLVSACSAGSSGAPTSVRPAPSSGSVPAPTILREAGLSSVIGEGASSLTRRFGDARIDLSEGDVRKLQFVSANCVLDIFLYPLERNAAPIATHVEARQRAGGGDADRARCIKDVEQAAQGQ